MNSTGLVYFYQKKERVCIFVTVACNPTKSIKRSCPKYFFIVDMKQNYFLQIYIRMAHSWMLLFKNETYVALRNVRSYWFTPSGSNFMELLYELFDNPTSCSYVFYLQISWLSFIYVLLGTLNTKTFDEWKCWALQFFLSSNRYGRKNSYETEKILSLEVS